MPTKIAEQYNHPRRMFFCVYTLQHHLTIQFSRDIISESDRVADTCEACDQESSCGDSLFLLCIESHISNNLLFHCIYYIMSNLKPKNATINKNPSQEAKNALLSPSNHDNIELKSASICKNHSFGGFVWKFTETST